MVIEYWALTRDLDMKKIKFEGQLSLIGGTMGLLTGFSIISCVEILYFATRFFAGFIKSKIETYLAIPNGDSPWNSNISNFHVYHNFMWFTALVYATLEIFMIYGNMGK